ncbi:uncharacterized protein J3R85_015178 [Psidium guajava]|nr:uncharacterized protein J3R85_015178 [Psidium guajava]
MITQRSLHPNAFIHRARCYFVFLLYTYSSLHNDDINNHTSTDSEESLKVKHRTNPKKLQKGKENKRGEEVYGREDESESSRLNSRYVGKGETFISLICIVSNACVIESRNEQD